VIYPDRNEFVPPGFSVVRYYQPNTTTIDDKVADNNSNNNHDVEKDGTSNILWDDTDINNMGSFSFEVEEEEESTYKKKSLMTPEGKIMEQSAPENGTMGNNNHQKRRTVMFGSEYARILSSSSPLSPSSNNNGQRSKNARRMKQSIKARFTSSSNKESVESGGSSSNSLILSLDDCPNSVATAAITDVIITSSSSGSSNNVIPPKGYYRAFPIGKKKDELLYVNVKKEPNWDRAVQRPCVTAICVIYPDRNEFVPPGFSVVRYYQPNTTTIDDKVADNNSNNKSIQFWRACIFMLSTIEGREPIDRLDVPSTIKGGCHTRGIHRVGKDATELFGRHDSQFRPAIIPCLSSTIGKLGMSPAIAVGIISAPVETRFGPKGVEGILLHGGDDRGVRCGKVAHYGSIDT